MIIRNPGTSCGRPLLGHALDAARASAAIGALPLVLNLIARDQATTDRLRVAEATYREAITPATESKPRTALASGKTTREAAAALFLSPKTIEYHLRHAYQKLGINSRPELARAFPDSG